MKSYDEYMDRIRSKAQKMKRRRAITASCSMVLVLALVLTLFLPYTNKLPSVTKYENSPYYKLINGLNKATYQPPKYENNYEWLKAAIGSMNRVVFAPTMDAVPEGVLTGGMNPTYGAAMNSATSVNKQEYVEVTDNQVQNVTESDIFKRSNQYIYYLRNNNLSVYSIEQEDSKTVGTFTLPLQDGVYTYNFEMFLSADCSTVTVISYQSVKDVGACVVLYSLDVSDPTNITLVNQQCFKGSYISSRMVDGDLLLIYNYGITGNINFDKPETFVPTYGTWDNMKPMDAEDIYCPAEDPSSARYTVVAKMDGESLEVMDCAALLSYSQQVYVSEDAVYATYGCSKRSSVGENTLSTTVTEITGISYRGENLDILGTITVNGSVKDQYSMDQHGDILRVATSTVEQVQKESNYGNYSWVQIISSKRNCDLYCIDLSTWEIASSVIAFAPEGEEVTSARFDGPYAYICTAEVIIMTDPVYFFDLSDIHNITYKHTPIIDGYSSSLVNFGDYLLGIGYNERRELKLEVYVETATGVEPIASYERACVFTEEYKAYFIDRKNGFIGLHVADADGTGNRPYVLLHFDGYKFHEVKVINSIVLDCALNTTRAFIADGYLYIFTENAFLVWPL